MHAAWQSVLVGLPVLLLHLALTTVLLLAGLGLFIRLVPVDELKLLREGNAAAAVAFSGQIMALAIPLTAMLASSVSAPDIILWGVVTVVLQFTAIFCLRRLLPGLAGRMARGEIASALVYACGQVVTGLLTAAALSG